MSINVVQIIFQIVNFSILLVLMKRFLYKPMINILEQRSKKIEAGLEAAEKSIEEQEKMEKTKKKIITQAEKDASQILEGARVRAKKVERQLAEQAEKEADRKLKKAEELSKSRMRQMESELSRKFSQAVLQTTESLLKDSLTEKQQQAIIQSNLKKLKEVKFS